MAYSSKRYIVRLFAPGIGDAVVQHGMFRTLKREGWEVTVWCKSMAQVELLQRSPWVEHAYLVEEGREGVVLNNLEPPFKYLDQASTSIESNYYWGSPEFIEKFGQIHITEVVELMFGKESKYRYEDCRFVHRIGTIDRSLVLLAPGGRRRSKLWPTEYWKVVYDYLVSKGFSPVIVGDPSHAGSEQVGELKEQGCLHKETSNVGHLIDLVSRARAIISVDSGVLHIAAAQGRPAIGLFGPMQEWLWGPRTTINLQGWYSCPGRSWCIYESNDWACTMKDFEQGCMKRTIPSLVLEAFETLVRN